METVTVDRARLFDRVAGDRTLLEELVEMYSGSRPALLRDLEAAIESGDAGLLERKAHRLKGTFNALAARAASAKAGRIEANARSGDFSAARRELDLLTLESKAVESELRRIESESWGDSVESR